MKTPFRSIARNLMHSVIVFSIVCGYAQNASAKPTEYVMPSPYVDVGALARWDAGATHQYVYFMNQIFFGNHEMLAAEGSVTPGYATPERVKATFDAYLNYMNYYIQAEAFYNRTAHQNYYYMFDAINRVLTKYPNNDVAYGGVKIPNAIAKALWPMAKGLVTPHAILSIAPAAQTSDLTCTSNTVSAAVYQPAYQPSTNCKKAVALFFIFQIGNAVTQFQRWQANEPVGSNGWIGAVSAVVSAILFFAYEYHFTRDEVVQQEAINPGTQTNQDDALAIAEAGNAPANATIGFVNTIAFRNNDTNVDAARARMNVEVVDAERRAARQAADPNVPRPPTFDPVSP